MCTFYHGCLVGRYGHKLKISVYIYPCICDLPDIVLCSSLSCKHSMQLLLVAVRQATGKDLAATSSIIFPILLLFLSVIYFSFEVAAWIKKKYLPKLFIANNNLRIYPILDLVGHFGIPVIKNFAVGAEFQAENECPWPCKAVIEMNIEVDRHPPNSPFCVAKISLFEGMLPLLSFHMSCLDCCW